MMGGAPWEDRALIGGVRTRRLLAWIIDIILIGMLVWIAWWSLLLFGLMTLGFGLPLLATLPLIPLAYHLLFLASPLAATPGQALLGLIVLRDEDLGRPTAAQAVVSTLGFYMTLALGAVWLAASLVTRGKRTLHDLLSGLVVVRRGALAGALTQIRPGWNMAGGYPRP